MILKFLDHYLSAVQGYFPNGRKSKAVCLVAWFSPGFFEGFKARGKKKRKIKRKNWPILRAKHEKGFRMSFNLFNDANIPRIIMHTFYWGCCIWFLLKSIQLLVQLYATPRTVAHQAPLSMGSPRQVYWSGLPFPTPGESSQLRDRTHISCTGKWVFYHCATWEARKNI